MQSLVWAKHTQHSIWRGYVQVPFMINVALNAMLPFVFFGHLESIPMAESSPSVHSEVTATAILLPALTGLICWPLIKRDVRSGRLEVPVRSDSAGYRIGELLILGLEKVGKLMSTHYLIAVVVATTLWGPMIYAMGRWTLWLLNMPDFTLIELAVFKALLAGIGGLGVAPFLCVTKLASEVRA